MSKRKIVIACDSFKGSASSLEVNQYIEEGIKEVSAAVDIVKVPIADGGEGTVESLVEGLGGEYRETSVIGPYGKKVRAKFGLIHNNQTAIIEMAEASGLQLVQKEEMNPFEATSYGTGQLILAALNEGVAEIYIGIGGSATNDGGFGMARALGAQFLDEEGNEITEGIQSFSNIHKIDVSKLDERLKKVKVSILSDVTNPLCGKNGASYIYGPQKGAKEADLALLDKLLGFYGNMLEKTFGTSIAEVEGAGAAGGLGAGLIAFCNAKMLRGIEEILRLLDFNNKIKDAHLVITGEGKMDGQTLSGKAPIGIALRAKKLNIPVIAIVGYADEDLDEVYKSGINLVLPTTNKPMSLDEAIKDVKYLISNAGEVAYRAYCIGNQGG